MELLESFGAAALLRRVRCLDDGAASAACTSFRGAVLFADISDFTALAETLCSQGPDGVEQLGDTLNLAFRSSLCDVHDTGGQIDCFAGTGIIAYWPDDEGDDTHELA